LRIVELKPLPAMVPVARAAWASVPAAVIRRIEAAALCSSREVKVADVDMVFLHKGLS
jgi:hypothetical protein